MLDRGEVRSAVRRPYSKDGWIREVLRDPLRTEVPTNARVRRWAYIQEAGRHPRVVTEPDGETVHNAVRARFWTAASSREI